MAREFLSRPCEACHRAARALFRRVLSREDGRVGPLVCRRCYRRVYPPALAG